MGTGSFLGIKCGRDVLLTTHPLLVTRSWKSRAISVHTLWATPGLDHFTFTCKNRDLVSRKAIFLNSALCCLFHAKAERSRCGMSQFGIAERLQAIWGSEQLWRTAWHWEALHKLLYNFVSYSSPHPHSKPCISREIVSPCVTQHQVDPRYELRGVYARLKYECWWQSVLKLQIVSATFLLLNIL